MESKFKCLVDFLLYSPTLSQNIINNLENSNKIILNANILNKLSKSLDKIESQMIFKITNTTEFGIYESFVGVHDFSASGNKIYISNNIADNLFVERNSIIDIEYYVPPKGTYIKIKPKNKQFYDIQEVKYILEKNIINNYPVLSVGDNIRIKYFDSIIELKIEKCLPFDVISTNNTDLEVDFTPINIDKPKIQKTEIQKTDIKKTEIQKTEIQKTENNQYVNKIKDTTDFKELDLDKKNIESEINALKSVNPRIKAFMERRQRQKLQKKTKGKLLYKNTAFIGKGYTLN